MRYTELLSEKYTAANSRLLKHLRHPEFDPYTYWNEIRVFFEEFPAYLEYAAEAAGKPLHDADELNEEEPDLFYRLPDWLKKESEEWILSWLHTHDPAEAPTYSHVHLRSHQLVPRGTWLVHFTDEPDQIAEQGFRIGIADINKLGLTTYFQKDAFEKKYGGYNFAFFANSPDAEFAAEKHNYGRHAVMFQNSGVDTFHLADEERQVIFNGEDVDPRQIVVLHCMSGDWQVKSRRRLRNGGWTLFAGDFEPCVQWVEHNFAQYRRYLTAL